MLEYTYGSNFSIVICLTPVLGLVEATILPGQFLGLKAVLRSPFCGDDFGVVTPLLSGDKHFLGESGIFKVTKKVFKI